MVCEDLGWGRGGRDVSEGADIRIHTADSLKQQKVTALQSSCTPIKNAFTDDKCGPFCGATVQPFLGSGVGVLPAHAAAAKMVYQAPACFRLPSPGKASYWLCSALFRGW